MLKEKELIDSDLADKLAETFPGLDGELMASQLNNKDRHNRGNRYSDPVKKFSLTLHFYSPRAYEYLRTIFDLPCPRSIRVWTSSVSCEPGFFQDVFLHLKQLVAENPDNSECTLMFDEMAIRKGTDYNKSTGNIDGFVDFGMVFEDLEDDDDNDTIASQALVFMLTALRMHWKFVIGFAFTDKIGAVKQHGMVARALELAFDHDLEVKTAHRRTSAQNSNIRSFRSCPLLVREILLFPHYSNTTSRRTRLPRTFTQHRL